MDGSDHVLLAAQVAELVRCRAPLATGLRAAAAEMPRKRLARKLRSLADCLESGDSLEASLGKVVERLPESLQSLIWAGLRTGHLDEALEEYVRQEQRAGALRRSIRSALAYPALLVLLPYALLIFFIGVIIPPFKNLFEDFGTELPPVTQVVLAIADLGPVLPTACLAAVFIPVAISLKLGGRAGAWVPLLGPVFRYSALANFCRMLGLLVAREVPMPEALRIVRRAMRDRAMRESCWRLSESVAAGQSLGDALARERTLPATLRALVNCGENPAGLAESLGIVAEFYEGRARRRIVVMRAAASPLAILPAIAAIGFVVFSLFMPLIKIIETLT